MHNKFLVRVGAADQAEAVLAGSANFTGEGLSAQANVLHAFESPQLAELYLDRKRLLDGDPALSATQRTRSKSATQPYGCFFRQKARQPGFRSIR